MKKALEYIVSQIVDQKDTVEIKEEREDTMVHYTIAVAKEDMGKIIGKSGKVIRAIRNVLKIPAIKQGVRVDISLEEK